MASHFPILYSPARALRSMDSFMDLSRQMNRMMDNFFPGASNLMGMGASTMAETAPRIDVQEDPQQICITADLPGVCASDVDVRIDIDVLTICGEKRSQSVSSLESYRIMERTYGSFHRTIPLPFAPDPKQIQAEYGQGVLTIRIPKQAQMEGSQRIPIKEASDDGQRSLLEGDGQILDENGQAFERTDNFSAEEDGMTPAQDTSQTANRSH